MVQVQAGGHAGQEVPGNSKRKKHRIIARCICKLCSREGNERMIGQQPKGLCQLLRTMTSTSSLER